ncbi:MAG: diguanylate cyclase [Pseudomonadota bacterium]|nr:diguanylate cyclase [Pseudomonadota bacterium]
MSSGKSRQLTDDEPPAAALTRALDQSEHVKTLVEECAEDLSSVNTALTQELASTAPPPRVAVAIEKSGVVESKIQDASEQLAVVNEALKAEVKERHVLEDRLTALTAQSEADRHASFHDPLTGLPNRALFNDRLEHGLAQATRHGWIMAVMFLDLDNFKTINDQSIGIAMSSKHGTDIEQSQFSHPRTFRTVPAPCLEKRTIDLPPER